ncbi:hypothetical protein vBSlqSZDD2_34 [Serratia phage vB_SlqS_ZDD2]|nr:hypothetical protein vBSlqSZDD2_34 [Serratia phage vB_SlqS_ZDD2]
MKRSDLVKMTAITLVALIGYAATITRAHAEEPRAYMCEASLQDEQGTTLDRSTGMMFVVNQSGHYDLSIMFKDYVVDGGKYIKHNNDYVEFVNQEVSLVGGGSVSDDTANTLLVDEAGKTPFAKVKTANGQVIISMCKEQ